MRAKQANFFSQPSFKHLSRLEHGGVLGQGSRKLFRPIDTKRSLHLVLRASKARGEYSMLRQAHERKIQDLIYKWADKNDVKIYQYANSGNHLHMLIKARTKPGFQRFLKTISGLIARVVTGSRKGVKFGKFWDALAYTRIVSWGKSYFQAKYYVILNELEAAGVWSRNFKSTPLMRP